MGQDVAGKHPYHKLTALGVRKMSTPGRYADGNGLYLVVDSSGAKRWMQRLIVQGKRRDLGLGSVSLVSLDDARELAFKNRRRARSGGNPLDDKKKATGDSISLKDAALAVHALNNGTWKSKKHAKQWFSSLESHLFPKIGHISISQISSADVMSVLSSIWISKHETARRVVQRIRSIIKWARAQGYHSGDDPVEIALAALPKNSAKPQHHDSLPFNELPELYNRINNSELSTPTKLALRFLILTAARTTEVLEADWSEIDLQHKIWTVPASRMKASQIHQVPLSDEVITILEAVDSGRHGLIFASPVNGRSLSNNTLRVALQKRLKVKSTVHGLRSTFKDWASEKTNHANEVSEMALAHSISNQVEAAYRRGDLLEKRRQLMQDWSSFVTGQDQTVITLVKARQDAG